MQYTYQECILYCAGTEGRISLETAQIDSIESMSLQLVDDESGDIITTAACHRCANRLLANVSLPQTRVRYRAVGTDTCGRTFDISLSKTNTFTEAEFRVEMSGESHMEVETGQVVTINVTVYNLHNNSGVHYSFTPESVVGFRQAFQPNSLTVPPRGSGFVTMVILPLLPTSPGTHTFTATAIAGCVVHSVSKTVTFVEPVRNSST